VYTCAEVISGASMKKLIATIPSGREMESYRRDQFMPNSEGEVGFHDSRSIFTG
jgi:hypothetical protein